MKSPYSPDDMMADLDRWAVAIIDELADMPLDDPGAQRVLAATGAASTPQHVDHLLTSAYRGGMGRRAQMAVHAACASLLHWYAHKEAA